MAEFNGAVGDTSTEIVAANVLIHGVTVQNKSALPLTMRVSASAAVWDTGFLLKGGEALYLPAGVIPSGAAITGIRRTGESGHVYAVGA